jgi:hypothetical protein
MEDLQFPGKETVISLVVMDQERALSNAHGAHHRIVRKDARPARAEWFATFAGRKQR